MRTLLLRLKSLSLGFLAFLLFSCSAGDIQLSYDKSKSGSLTPDVGWVLSESSLSISETKSKREFIAFPIQKSFLKAGFGEPEVKYRMASFKFKDSVTGICENQTIEDISSDKSVLSIKGEVKGKNCESKYLIKITAVSKTELSLEISFSEKNLNRIWLNYASSKEEGFYGFGEQFSHTNLKGKKPFLFTEEQGIGRGDQPITAGANVMAGAGGNEYTTYAPIPHYITTENRSIFFENAGYSQFDLTQDSEVGVHFWDFNSDKALNSSLKASIWLGNNPRELVEVYTKKTGRFPVLPDWAYGTWLGIQGGTEKVKSVINEAKKAGNPITALWIQDWCGRRVTNFGDQLKWRWYADEALYPNFKQFVSEMNKDNIAVLGYINSFLADTDPKKPGDDFTNSLLEEAKKKNYLVKNAKNEDYLIQTVGFPAYLIDLTNPEAVVWIKGIIKKNMIDQGLSGWMADFGEWLPFDAKLFSGVSARVYHNQYPVDWAKVNREAIKEAGKEGKIVFFTRAGYSYSNAYSTLFWEGDQMVSWGKHDGLPSSIIGLTSSGISGYALNHSDIGGYTTISNPLRNYHRSKELLLRWAEASAFTPVFRTHEGNRPLKNWQVYQFTNKEGKASQSDSETVCKVCRFGKAPFCLKRLYKRIGYRGV
jgi:sulfoquinovosidase